MDVKDERRVPSCWTPDCSDVDRVYEFCATGGRAVLYAYMFLEAVGWQSGVTVITQVISFAAMFFLLSETASDGCGDRSFHRMMVSCAGCCAMSDIVVELGGDGFENW
jgi:hypothetical protein